MFALSCHLLRKWWERCKSILNSVRKCRKLGSEKPPIYVKDDLRKKRKGHLSKNPILFASYEATSKKKKKRRKSVLPKIHKSKTPFCSCERFVRKWRKISHFFRALEGTLVITLNVVQQFTLFYYVFRANRI